MKIQVLILVAILLANPTESKRHKKQKRRDYTSDM